MRTYRDTYPCGRKFCAVCKHWRHAVDFNVRTWADDPHCTVPRTLASACITCLRIKNREKHGHKPANWYSHGIPGTERYRQHCNRMNRESARQRRKDPDYRKSQREYERIWRNARFGSVARARRMPNEDLGTLDAAGVWGYLKRFYKETITDRTGTPTVTLNGRLPSSRIARLLQDLKFGRISSITLIQADRIAADHDFPLWELEEAGQLLEAAA